MQSLIFIGSIINTVIAPLIGKIEEVEFPQFIIQYADFFNTTSVEYMINCCIMVFFIIKLVFETIHKNKKRIDTLVSVMDSLHSGYIHDMRDHIHDLEEVAKTTYNMDFNKNLKEYEALYNAEYKVLEKVVQQCVDQISDFINDCMGLSEDTSDTICTCVKMVSIHEEEKAISERSVITLARSRNSSRKRKQGTGKHTIGKNTDFLDLSKGYRNFYSGVNLKDKFKKGEYDNSTPDFSYESTVVVPIRFSDLHSNVSIVPAKGKKKRVEIKIQSDVDIVGYLCIDTEKVLHEWENKDDVEKIVKILAFYADSLYVYLSTFQRTFTVKMER